MGFFKNLIKREQKPVQEPPPEVRLPYETLWVPGNEAIQAIVGLRADGAGEYTPVILGGPEDTDRIVEGFEANACRPEEDIAKADSITMASFLEKRRAEDPDLFQDVETGSWPGRMGGSMDLTGHTDILTGKPLPHVAICRAPTPRHWEAPAHLCFGGWNECPFPEEHTAILEHWSRNYGAQIVTLISDRLECTVERPPLEKSQAVELAREQFAYCPDIVHQGTETLSALAAALINAPAWYFWWD